MRALRFIAICLCVAIGGCVSANDPNAVAQNTQTSFNRHTGLQEYTGAPSPLNGNIMQGLFNIRGWKGGKGDSAVHQIYMVVSSPDWLFLDSAYSYGRSLPLTQIDRSVGSCSAYGCTVNETVGINVTTADLRRYAVSGFSVQLTGRRGNRVVNIPGTYFQGYLIRINGNTGIAGEGPFPPKPKA